MVAKPIEGIETNIPCLNLAKIHMVAKHVLMRLYFLHSLNLAKIHMVAKPLCTSSTLPFWS